MTKIFLGADHRGFEQKQQLAAFLRENPAFEVVDFGANEYDPDDDFNDPAIAVASAVRKDPNSFGVLLCGSSFGICIQANRFKGVRAVNPLTVNTARLGREHNAANVLCLSADQLNLSEMEILLETFLTTPSLDEPRYNRRNRRLDEVENG